VSSRRDSSWRARVISPTHFFFWPSPPDSTQHKLINKPLNIFLLHTPPHRPPVAFVSFLRSNLGSFTSDPGACVPTFPATVAHHFYSSPTHADGSYNSILRMDPHGCPFFIIPRCNLLQRPPPLYWLFKPRYLLCLSRGRAKSLNSFLFSPPTSARPLSMLVGMPTHYSQGSDPPHPTHNTPFSQGTPH